MIKTPKQDLNYHRLKKVKFLGQYYYKKHYLTAYVLRNPLNGAVYTINRGSAMILSPKFSPAIKDAFEQFPKFKELEHPNLVKFRDAKILNNNALFFVSDYFHGKTLEALIKDQKGQLFEEEQILSWFVQICSAIKYLHDQSIIYRDLQPDHVLFSGNTVKLQDFVLVQVTADCEREFFIIPENRRRTRSYKYHDYSYRSPEFLKDKLETPTFTDNIWSLGVILYKLCTLRWPFEGTCEEACKKALIGQYYPVPRKYSAGLLNLIQNLFQVNTDKRPTIYEVLDHDLLKNISKLHDRSLQKQNLLDEAPRTEETQINEEVKSQESIIKIPYQEEDQKRREPFYDLEINGTAATHQGQKK